MAVGTIKKFDFGGDCSHKISCPEIIDVSKLGFFDELEYDCWDLIKKYAEKLGIEIKNEVDADNSIDFYSAKQVQDRILGLFSESGVIFKTDPGTMKWYAVRTKFLDRGAVKVESFTAESDTRPENENHSRSGYDEYVDYFPTKEAAEKFASEALKEGSSI